MMNIEPLSLRKDILNFAKLEVGHMDFAWFRLTLPRAMPAVEPLATRRLRPRARCAARATVWNPRPVGPSPRTRAEPPVAWHPSSRPVDEPERVPVDAWSGPVRTPGGDDVFEIEPRGVELPDRRTGPRSQRRD
jgi:hypothetical protein